MTASADDAPPRKDGDAGWDESVLVWNATVARIPAPAVQPDSARGVGGEKADAESPSAKTRRAGARPARRRASP